MNSVPGLCGHVDYIALINQLTRYVSYINSGPKVPMCTEQVQFIRRKINGFLCTIEK